MHLSLEGRHALVCGASQGIGRAVAVELAQLGARVSVLARSADTLEAVAQSLPRPHGQLHGWHAVDMADTAALADMAATLVAAGPVHILVNNSGGPAGGSAHDADRAAYEAAFRQHLLAAQTLLQAVLPGMRAEGYGRLVNVISTSVKEPIPGLGVSNTIRAAMAGWAKTLAGELAADGITVNNVLPGYTRTQRLEQILADRSAASGKPREEIAKAMLASVPVGRFAEAAEIAGMIAFLCTPAAAYVDGQSIAVDGGRMQSI